MGAISYCYGFLHITTTHYYPTMPAPTGYCATIAIAHLREQVRLYNMYHLRGEWFSSAEPGSCHDGETQVFSISVASSRHRCKLWAGRNCHGRTDGSAFSPFLRFPFEVKLRTRFFSHHFLFPLPSDIIRGIERLFR